MECHFTTGPYTMLVKLFARDNEDLIHLHDNKPRVILALADKEALMSVYHPVPQVPHET